MGGVRGFCLVANPPVQNRKRIENQVENRKRIENQVEKRKRIKNLVEKMKKNNVSIFDIVKIIEILGLCWLGFAVQESLFLLIQRRAINDDEMDTDRVEAKQDHQLFERWLSETRRYQMNEEQIPEDRATPPPFLFGRGR